MESYTFDDARKDIGSLLFEDENLIGSVLCAIHYTGFFKTNLNSVSMGCAGCTNKNRLIILQYYNNKK